MTIPVFVDEVLRGRFADGSEPLRAKGRHPDEISGHGWVPVIAQAVDSASFEHHESVFHDVGFNETERCAGCEGHEVDGEIEFGCVRDERLHEHAFVAH